MCMVPIVRPLGFPWKLYLAVVVLKKSTFGPGKSSKFRLNIFEIRAYKFSNFIIRKRTKCLSLVAFNKSTCFLSGDSSSQWDLNPRRRSMGTTLFGLSDVAVQFINNLLECDTRQASVLIKRCINHLARDMFLS